MFGLSVSECFFIIVLIFALIYWLFPKRAVWISFLITAILMAVLAFNITPNESDDLARYFDALDSFRENGIDALNHYIDSNIFGWNTFRMGAYYFYAISRLPNDHFLPAITIFIVYGLMFSVIYRASVHFSVSKLYLFMATFFVLSTYWYYDTASGIRNGLAFSIGFTCAYYHLVEKRNTLLCCIGYVISAFMHSSGILPVVFVVTALLTTNFAGKYLKILLVFGISGGAVLINYLSEVTDNSFIQAIAGKAESYNADDIVTVASGSGSGGTTYYVTAATFIFVFIMMWYVSPYITKGEYFDDLKRFHQYSSLVMYFLIGCLLTEGLVFMRFTRWLVPIIGALYFMIGMQEQKNKLDKLGRHIYDESMIERIRYLGRSVFMLIVFAYSCIHLWYLMYGSSLFMAYF